LLPLGGATVLHQVLRRCGRITGADAVMCAVPNEPASASLEEIARSCSALVFRGSEKDVLDRYLGAGRAAGADIIMRVTSDCPLIDPVICDDVLRLRRETGADYAANNMPRTFPHGLDCEAFTVTALTEAATKTRDPYDREHVTPWLRRAPHLKHANLAAPDASHSGKRWTLDYAEDFAFMQAVYAALPGGCTGSMGDILGVLATRPEIETLNSQHR
jgi:spore coat polysaccharide biosynthesis protein SpsF